MLYREIIAVCSQIHTKHINTLCGQNVELLSVKFVDTESNYCALKVKVWCQFSVFCFWVIFNSNLYSHFFFYLTLTPHLKRWQTRLKIFLSDSSWYPADSTGQTDGSHMFNATRISVIISALRNCILYCNFLLSKDHWSRAVLVKKPKITYSMYLQ